ncbi:hypothetical protein LSAT2_014172 [Lamellibrachia satsuma]|nr:hypothetical protein LSAT2_014172 [Lamellibrachia satsuma]
MAASAAPRTNTVDDGSFRATELDCCNNLHLYVRRYLERHTIDYSPFTRTRKHREAKPRCPVKPGGSPATARGRRRVKLAKLMHRDPAWYNDLPSSFNPLPRIEIDRTGQLVGDMESPVLVRFLSPRKMKKLDFACSKERKTAKSSSMTNRCVEGRARKTSLLAKTLASVSRLTGNVATTPVAKASRRRVAGFKASRQAMK